MYEMSRVYYLNSINRKVTKKTILEYLRIICQHDPFLSLSFLVVHTVYIYLDVIQSSKTFSPTLLSESTGLICFLVLKASNLSINLWLFCLLTLNPANFYCVRSYICSSNTTGVYNLTTW